MRYQVLYVFLCVCFRTRCGWSEVPVWWFCHQQPLCPHSCSLCPPERRWSQTTVSSALIYNTFYGTLTYLLYTRLVYVQLDYEISGTVQLEDEQLLPASSSFPWEIPGPEVNIWDGSVGKE